MVITSNQSLKIVDDAYRVLKSSVSEAREKNYEGLSEGTIGYDRYLTTERELDRKDPQTLEDKARGARRFSRGLVGFLAGAAVGYQGGPLALGVIGAASASSYARARYIEDETDRSLVRCGYYSQPHLLEKVGKTVSDVGEALLIGGGLGGLSSVGKIFGAAVGGICGAVIACCLPGQFGKEA